MGKDLGTYHVRVEYENGKGHIDMWNTGVRFIYGGEYHHPLTAKVIQPTWENEVGLLKSILFIYTKGNYSCDCNRRIMCAQAEQKPEPGDNPCGNEFTLKRLTVIRPDLTETILWEKDNAIRRISEEGTRGDDSQSS